jgi:hypothetical protein
MSQFDVGDRIIGGTAAISNAIVMTLNGRDYPQPFFRELERRMIDYQSKDWPVCVPVYFMEPQLEFIAKLYDQRVADVQPAATPAPQQPTASAAGQPASND